MHDDIKQDMVYFLKDDRGELLLSETTEGEIFPFCCFGHQIKTPLWQFCLSPEYIFPVISYRPHAMPYLRTEERKEKKMNE